MAPQQPVPNPLLDPLDITPLPKPFKSPHWKPAPRRNKNLKQILQEDLKTLTLAANPAANPAAASSTAAPSASNPGAVGATYTNIESAPSFHPARAHWCDITGLPSKYVDPRTKLRYADVEVYRAIRELPPGGKEGYLELRGANVVLK
ncbi:hypothetical protein EV426DRAFT_631649 [Tirmania nivea]|nr:hypothetical protein EV426DRAFT_631649 [Tirmania nivea]